MTAPPLQSLASGRAAPFFSTGRCSKWAPSCQLAATVQRCFRGAKAAAQNRHCHGIFSTSISSMTFITRPGNGKRRLVFINYDTAARESTPQDGSTRHTASLKVAVFLGCCTIVTKVLGLTRNVLGAAAENKRRACRPQPEQLMIATPHPWGPGKPRRTPGRPWRALTGPTPPPWQP